MSDQLHCLAHLKDIIFSLFTVYILNKLESWFRRKKQDAKIKHMVIYVE